jgi:hypothetical protein
VSDTIAGLYFYRLSSSAFPLFQLDTIDPLLELF